MLFVFPFSSLSPMFPGFDAVRMSLSFIHALSDRLTDGPTTDRNSSLSKQACSFAPFVGKAVSPTCCPVLLDSLLPPPPFFLPL